MIHNRCRYASIQIRKVIEWLMSIKMMRIKCYGLSSHHIWHLQNILEHATNQRSPPALKPQVEFRDIQDQCQVTPELFWRLMVGHNLTRTLCVVSSLNFSHPTVSLQLPIVLLFYSHHPYYFDYEFTGIKVLTEIRNQLYEGFSSLQSLCRTGRY